MIDRLKAALADRYTIECELGSGGMATVYLARDLKHDRKVAVKVFRPALAAAVGTERFFREIKITANLQHPHILPLHDSGESDGFLYYVMPFVEGETLRNRLNREKQLPVDEALKITSQVASALSYAHSRDIVHRDIKPENILFQAGEVAVADFGIALAVDSAGGTRLTETGFSLGTPAYMSPEQVSGEQEIDGRSDVYSLACVLYEMLAGDPPFVASTSRAVLAKHMTDPAPPITTVRSSVPRPVVAALTKALGKAPVDRFESAKAFSDALFAAELKIEEEKKSIVVLPFTNLSPDPDNEYFADGLTEEIITDLSQVRSLLVISRNSAMRLKNTEKDTRTIGHELGVRYVLEGTVRKAGKRLRIAAQLVDAERDVHLWADKFTGTLEDVFELQEGVSRCIVEALEVELSPEELQKIAEHAVSGSVEAYDHYLLGRHHMNRLTQEGLRTAVDHFQCAVELQPDFARAYAGLADSYMLLTQGSGEPPRENFPKARAAIQKALEIDASLEEAHTSLGGIRLFFDWDWDGAERALRRAIELNPNYGQAHHWLAILFNAQARHEEALEAMRRALALDPLSPYVNLNVGWIHYTARQFDAALTHLIRAMKAHPESPGIRAVLGVVYAAKEMFDQAITEFKGVMDAAGQGFIMLLPMLGNTLARAGRIADARKLLRDMEEMEKRRFVNPDYFTIIHIGLQEYDKALDRLEEATEARTDWPLWFSVDPMVDPIRTHPRFAALLEKIGLARPPYGEQ